jgi:acyl-CoA dehydrogenase
MRAGAMAGALARVLDLSLAHARTRRQFGKPLGDFQAVQHMLAELAEETAAATVAAEAAFQAAESASAEMAIAAAKIRASTAADKGAALAHQIHGALGFTAEHTLHLFTRRLWAWRDDYGDASHHARALGRLAAQRGADALWPFLSPSPGR